MLARTPRTAAFLAKPPAKRLTAAQRDVLIAAVAKVLLTGRPTRFAFEAACLQGIRAAFCLAGWKWTRAHLAAADVTEAALRRIAAHRPSWQEGQREYTGHEELLRCTNKLCQRPIEREPGDVQRRLYCSAVCKAVVTGLRYREDRREEARAASAAWRAARRAQAKPKPCETCGKPFQPLQQGNRPEPSFCSRACRPQAGRNSGSHPWVGKAAEKA